MLAPQSYWFAIITSFTPFALGGYLVASLLLVLLLRGTPPVLRRWVVAGTALAVLGAGFHALLLAPLFLGDHPRGPADLTVMNLNLRLGNGDPATTVRLVREQQVDLLVLEEVTPALAARLSDAGLDEALPYAAGGPGAGAAGTVVRSAYPLEDDVRLLGVGHGVHRVRVQAPVPFWLIAVHLGQPLDAKGLWRPDWAVLAQVLPGLEGPVVAVGDFNTTLDHGPMRDLLSRGFTDAARESNAGWQPTWPRRGLLAIDHVLFSAPFGAVGTATFPVAGTDHRALVARLVR